MAAPEDGPSGETPHKPGGDSETAGNTAHASAALVAAHEEPPPAEAEHVPSHILPSNFGSTFSYTKNEGHPERDGFGNTFSAQPGTASPGVAPQINEEPAHKTGMLAAFMDYLYLGPKVANEPDYLPLTKRLVLIIISITGVLGPLTGSIYSPALPAVKAEFHTTTEWVNGTLTAGILALGIAPLAWSPVSDRNGRRIILILSQLCNIGGCVICYFSPSIYVFLVGRIIQAAGSGAGLSVGAGVVADVFKREERGRAFGVFYLGPLIGPVVAPAIGGALTQSAGWHHIFSFSAGLGALVLLSTFFFFPETLTSRRRHVQQPSSVMKGDETAVNVGGPGGKPPAGPPPARNPLKAFVNLKYQFYAAPVAVGSAGFGAFYALPSLVPLTWPSIYGYNTSQIGLFLMSSGFGFIAGSLLGGYMADKVFQVWKVRRGGVIVAEDRLRSTVISMVLYPLGLLLYGWPVDHHISAAVPTIGMFIMGFSSMIINTSTNSYMLDCFTTNAAAVVAVSNFVRFVAAGVVPLVAYPIANAIGQGWFMTILAALNVATYVWLVYIQEYGTGIRVKSEPWSKSLEVVRGDEIVKFSRTKARRSPWYLRLIDKADITITPDDMDEIDRLARARLGMPEESNEKDKAAALGEEVVVVSEGGKDQLGEAVPAEKKGDEGGSSATDSVGNGSK